MQFKPSLCQMLTLGLIFMSIYCNYSSNEVVENKIRSMLVGSFGCDPETITIVQLKDGIVNCHNNMNYQITIGDKKYFAKYGNPNGEILGVSTILCK